MTTSTSTFVPAPAESQADFKTRFLARLTPPVIAVVGIMLLAALLNFINIDSIGQANTYYTAAIEAMLQSPSNFFFAAAEPGGSVTIDKPPVGLWLQAISAFFLGVSGFSVVLPQILAGIFSVPLLYALIKRYFGTGAGLIAALVMAIMPVSVAVQRNNTMDATLIFTLLLAAWAFIQATEHGKLKWLLLGAALVGIGFNIKMMQAFLPLPAFYGLYFLGSKVAWRTRIVHLVVTTVLLLAVSLSWIIVVDLVPAENRPYVGSSQTNSALELAVGYNGIQRLLGGTGRAPANRQNDGQGSTTNAIPGTGTDGQGFAPPVGANGQPMPPPAGAPGAGGGMFANEVGTASVVRLFTQPLDNEIGWLLPFGLLSIGLLAVASRPRLPLSTAHKGVILWGGWLVTQVVFFSVAGFFHAYYLAMLTPPLAALVGIGVMRLWEGYPGRRWLSWSLLIGFAAATLAWQASIAAGYINSVTWMLVPAVTLALGTLILIGTRLLPQLSRYAIVGLACVVITLTVVPAVWTGLSSAQTSANVNLPSAYSGTQSQGAGPGGANLPPGAPAGQDGNPANRPGGGFGGGVDQTLLTYLQANTAGMRWMMAVGSSQQGAGYVLETGRGVLYMGGFSGQDRVVNAESLQAYVDAGDLRYVLGGRSGQSRAGMSTDTSIQTWLESSCAVVTDLNLSSGTLFDCAA
ncbi:MAG TPA: glycosyltransferase family 39 protein [Aggregatilineales bacterium]|nr:glycosyltransferase family 39 protein [Aggregatilineales bacterium]